ncbi:uncharacterized protein B0I36DRAFT_247928 [Microdochium trichocladiopsis]|uniref:Uncharacterized protein n=1 Tax=Microdochium trichocladiopsis TaxID=1682393 RepID=A0A9P8Y2P9_9PEZI|nr:uncharacterized protein B0I36DRAFT_247928 [Microdochium trichocladiopsis]KAH7026078.1 hypothetical protein B0I36DRAFT_247928 [Microdochium trichocladiopsis]
MAGLAPDAAIASTSFFNIFSDAPFQMNAPALPSGACNFTDLSHGPNGPKCGCRRFWSRASSAGFNGASPAGENGADAADQGTWCMCSHHACFHDDVREAPTSAVVPVSPGYALAYGQENERPRGNREPLTPVLPELSFALPSKPCPPSQFESTSHQERRSDMEYPMHSRAHTPPQAEAPMPQLSSLPDTQVWTDYLRSQPDPANLLPPIPSQCMMPSQPSSTTSSVRREYLRPFQGKGLQTFNGPKSRLQEPPLLAIEATGDQEDDHHSTISNVNADDQQTVTNTPRSTRTLEARDQPSQPPPFPGFFKDTLQQLTSTVHGHDQRLERLENVSFTADNHDECVEKHDQADLRMTEVEFRVGELEKMLNESSKVDESTQSVSSLCSSSSGRIMDRGEICSELRVLRAELSQLRTLSSSTCYTNPWEVEVVLLPFGLKGVWMAAHDFSTQRASSGSNTNSISMPPDEWTQLPSSGPTYDPQSPELPEWAGPELDSDWLLPRAVAPDRVIDKRLRSRGLVKLVQVRGPDARSVQQAITDAFGPLLRTLSRMQAKVHHGSTYHHRVANYHGLQRSWVPLRKKHKDSRLHFLAPEEMVTPVAWNVEFLTSSVVMKATGVQRLFITHPESYVQDQSAYDTCWSWQRLRELSRVYPDSQSSQDVPEADAMEDCWAWTDRLDEQSPSINSSQSHHQTFSLRQAAQIRYRSASLSSQALLTSISRPGSSMHGRRAASPRVSIPPFRDARSSPGPRRPVSVPPQSQSLVSPLMPPHRRVSSHTAMHVSDRRPSPLTVRPSMSAAYMHAAKRHGTRSPGLRQRQTPRWSTSSPSPMPDAYHPGRATTPFYATPYSIAPIAEHREDRGVGGPISGRRPVRDVEVFEDPSGTGVPMLDYDTSFELNQSFQTDRSDQSGFDSSQDADAQRPLPEDEPWPGIEDAENRDPELQGSMDGGRQTSSDFGDDLDIDIHVDEDAMSDGESSAVSDASSVPSEYPSTQRAWTTAPDGAFAVYEDKTGTKA